MVFAYFVSRGFAVIAAIGIAMVLLPIVTGPDDLFERRMVQGIGFVFAAVGAIFAILLRPHTDEF